MPEPAWSPDRLAVLVADGEKVDWGEVLSSASDDAQRRIIRHLRLVDSVARVHRSMGSSAFPTPAPSSMTETVDAPHSVDPLPLKSSWGHLELRERLGRGAFGEVYRAWDGRLDREVALKLLKADVSQETTSAATTVEEGRLLAKLRHPNVVTVYGAEVREGRIGIWMELIRGRSLEQLLRDQGPFGAREAVLVGIDLCRALAAVHGAGLVHRDVKAQNVMREEGGRILLTDFGAGIDVRGRRGDGRVSISGTPFYMAPELFLGESATPRSDLYSLGVLLYRVVTGAFPVEAQTWDELIAKHRGHDTKLLRDRRPDLPEGFVAVVERALARNPDDRFATAGGMEHALSLTLGTATEQTRKRSVSLPWRWGPLQITAALAVAGIALLSTIWILWRDTSSPERPPVPGTVVVPPTHAVGSPSPSVASPYTVEASLHRVRAHSNVRERVESGARLALGDSLTLEFKASAPLHVYVIDEDEAGHAFALFPLPGFNPQNPLPAGSVHVLPGSHNGKKLSWTVDTSGGREHLLMLASPTRLIEFEAEMNALAKPGQTAVSIPESAAVRLRGLGGLVETPDAIGGKPATHLFEMAQRLASRSEIVTGIWMRRIDLENPPR